MTTDTITAEPCAAGDAFPTLANLITLPVPSPQFPTHLVVHVTRFDGQSLLVWCGEAASAGFIEADAASAAESTAPKSSLLMEEHHPASSLPGQESTSSGPPTGVLGYEWAVAMSMPGSKVSVSQQRKLIILRAQPSDLPSLSPHQNVLSTSLFRSNLDLSKPMASRLAKRFNISQIFLSLALPDQMVQLLQDSYGEGNKALLLLEGALGKTIKQALDESR